MGDADTVHAVDQAIVVLRRLDRPANGQILRAQREAIYGIKLIRKASNWSIPNRTAEPSAANELTAVRHRRLKTIPVTQATPITNVIAISIGEK
jgi:hypothetical protein